LVEVGSRDCNTFNIADFLTSFCVFKVFLIVYCNCNVCTAFWRNIIIIIIIIIIRRILFPGKQFYRHVHILEVYECTRKLTKSSAENVA